MQRLGADWIFPEIPTTDTILAETRTKKSSPATLVHSMESLSLTDAEIDKKFAALVVHLACVEARVLMDELADELAATAATTKKEGGEIRQAKIRKEQVLPLVYEILEVSIGYLVLVSEDDELLERGLFDATALLKVQESLQAAFSAVLDYLLDLQVTKRSYVSFYSPQICRILDGALLQCYLFLLSNSRRAKTAPLRSWCQI